MRQLHHRRKFIFQICEIYEEVQSTTIRCVLSMISILRRWKKAGVPLHQVRPITGSQAPADGAIRANNGPLNQLPATLRVVARQGRTRLIHATGFAPSKTFPEPITHNLVGRVPENISAAVSLLPSVSKLCVCCVCICFID